MYYPQGIIYALWYYILNLITRRWVIIKYMFEIKVETKVTLSSGAAIALTETQDKSIKDFVLTTVLGSVTKPDEVTKPKRAYKRKHNYSNWTQDEDACLLELAKTFQGRRARYNELKVHFKKLHYNELKNHTYHAIEIRYYTLRNELKQASTWEPVSITHNS